VDASSCRGSCQPHFVSPIVTTHVMLVQQYRYDMSWQQDAVGATVNLELRRLTGSPNHPRHMAGSGNFAARIPRASIDDPRWIRRPLVSGEVPAVSATEGKGDYFVGLFLGGSLPTRRRMVWATLSYLPRLRPRRASALGASALGTFRVLLERIFLPPARTSWGARSFSIRPWITGSRERSGL
jgi:hypothetical protein